MRGIDPEPLVNIHPFLLAFAMTDYKVQGATLRHFLLNLIKRCLPPPTTITALNVLISRTTTRDGLPYLVKYSGAHDAFLNMPHPAHLRAWQNGYDENGIWSPSCVRQYCDEVMRRPKPPAPPEKKRTAWKRTVTLMTPASTPATTTDDDDDAEVAAPPQKQSCRRIAALTK